MYFIYNMIMIIAYYARAPHCPQNGPWTGAPQALQKLRGGAGGGISQWRSGAAAGISSAGGADGTGSARGAPLNGPDSTVPSDAQSAAADDVSDAQAVAAADDGSDTTVPNTWTSTIGGGAAAALARTQQQYTRMANATITATPRTPPIMPTTHMLDPPPPLPSSSPQSSLDPAQVGFERDSSQSQSHALGSGPGQSWHEHQPSQVGHVGPELP